MSLSSGVLFRLTLTIGKCNMDFLKFIGYVIILIVAISTLSYTFDVVDDTDNFKEALVVVGKDMKDVWVDVLEYDPRRTDELSN